MDRKKSIGVPMTEAEHAMVKALAENQGMTMSAYIRMVIKRLYNEATVFGKENKNDNV